MSSWYNGVADGTKNNAADARFSKKLLVMDEGRCLFYDTVPKVLAHHQELERIGVNVPRVVTLAGRLAELGLSPDRIPVNIDEAEQMVRRLIYGHA